jgi:putative oxidoreductase
MDAKRLDIMTSIGLLVIRVGIGGYMLTHGIGKLGRVQEGLSTGEWAFGDPLGLGPALSLILIMFAELVCAFLVLIGLGTRLFAAPLVFGMVVAAFIAHGDDPWTIAAARESGSGSKQLAMMYLTVFLALIFTGAGKFSMDGLIWPRFKAYRKRKKEHTRALKKAEQQVRKQAEKS